MIHFVGAGSGAADLITVRGKRLLEEADVIIYAGSLVNPELLSVRKEGSVIYNSASMTLEEVIDVMLDAEAHGLMTVRLHTGDPSLYSAIREQMDQLDAHHIAYQTCPGVSSFCGAASSLNLEYTLPDVAQSVIITRVAGRTPVPERENLRSLAAHVTTMVLFLSAGLLETVSAELIAGGYKPETPAAIVYRATWDDERKVICTVGTLAEAARAENIRKTALVLIGEVLNPSQYRRSDLYNPNFTTEYRAASKEQA